MRCGVRFGLALVIHGVLLMGALSNPFGAEPAAAQTSANISSAGFVFPLLAPDISSRFGKRKHPISRSVRHHEGIDLSVPTGTHVRAVTAGVVIFAGSYGGYGKLVSVQHAGGYSSIYGHLSDILVNPGQSVAVGQIVGRVGSTGLSTGPHLHFEWRKNGKTIDPLKAFPALAAESEG